MTDEIGPAMPERASAAEGFGRRIDALRAALESSPAEADRSRLRENLVALVQDLDAAMDELRLLRESMRTLAERYKEIFPRHRAAAERIDHLGASTFRERGWSDLARGEYEEAAAHLARAIDLDPEEVSARVMLAWARLHLGDLDGAGELLLGALERDPAHPLGRVIQAYRQLLGGDPDEAIRGLAGLVVGPGERTAALYAQLYLGLAYAARGMPREAQASFRRAIELGPGLAEAYYELGRSHFDEGRRDLALEAWRAGGQNRYNAWGERCRAEVERVETGVDAGGA